MPLIRFNVTEDMWYKTIDKMATITNRILKLYGPSTGKALFSEDGLPQIPITNKQWCQWVHYEHDEKTFWFRPLHRISLSGFYTKETYGPDTAISVAKSICWNAAVYIHTLKKPIGTESVRKAMKQSLILDSSCPDKLIDVVIESANRLCHVLLNAVSSEEGEINRCALYFLQEDLQARLGPRNCVNKSLRRHICNRLIVEGIATKKTRTEQQNMIRRAIISESRLKYNAVRAIERMLTSDPVLLNLNHGASILLPYTKKELKAILHDTHMAGVMQNNMLRAQEIKCKMKAKIPLTGAERKFKSKNKHLFR